MKVMKVMKDFRERQGGGEREIYSRSERLRGRVVSDLSPLICMKINWSRVMKPGPGPSRLLHRAGLTGAGSSPVRLGGTTLA